jgi:hypothetical protein
MKRLEDRNGTVTATRWYLVYETEEKTKRREVMQVPKLAQIRHGGLAIVPRDPYPSLGSYQQSSLAGPLSKREKGTGTTSFCSALSSWTDTHTFPTLL